VIFPESAATGNVTLSPAGPYATGERVTVRLTFTVGPSGLPAGGRLRWGLPNTGWERAVVPQHRYWDDLVRGKDRRYAPFHPVNTTAELVTQSEVRVALDTMERMVAPNEDPAEAYWRWWITATVEDEGLGEGDQIVLTYGDPRFIGQKARIQTFPEDDLTFSVYVDPGTGAWVRPAGAPIPLDVKAGPAVRANVVLPSTVADASPAVRVALTDSCHCAPGGGLPEKLFLRDGQGRRLATFSFSESPCEERTLDGKGSELLEGQVTLTDSAGKQIWGRANPAVSSLRTDDEHLYWGDLHAQSEYHVMHSQKKDSRQEGWSKGISCGTPDDVYRYARDTSLLDFVAITDQGANTGVGWKILQEKAIEYYEPGRFVTFKAYEAGSPVGHRNVYYLGDAVEPPQSSATFNYMPEFLYAHYRGRKDVLMIPHHVKAWTDWSYHDPDLEPLMEIYSCWGQSENPSLELWDKGMTPGAGAWEALERGYHLGMIASSDNHVGTPGRNYPHDRQVHTPFPGGLAAIWAPELTREALFEGLRNRRSYGTTGARIILRFSVDGHPMGSILDGSSRPRSRKLAVDVIGTEAISRVEIIRNGEVAHSEDAEERRRAKLDSLQIQWTDDSPFTTGLYYYVRVFQADGHRAWSSPIWVEG